MALIMNEEALSNFKSENVSSSDIVMYFSKIVQYNDAIYAIEKTDFDNKKDGDMPENIAANAQTCWQDEYKMGLKCKAAFDVTEYQLNIFSSIVNLLDMTENKKLSRNDVLDQLTSTLTSYDNNKSLQFLNDMQSQEN